MVRKPNHTFVRGLISAVIGIQLRQVSILAIIQAIPLSATETSICLKIATFLSTHGKNATLFYVSVLRTIILSHKNTT